MQDDFDLDLFLQELGIDLSEDTLADKPSGTSEEPDAKSMQKSVEYSAPAEPVSQEIPAEPVGQERPAEPAHQSAPAVSRRTSRPAESVKQNKDRKPGPVAPSLKDRAAEKKLKSTALRRSAPFFTALLALTVVAWALPLRPTVSESEKRSLKTFPEFSVSALFSGDYFSGIDDWFSDTFTFRENWIGYANEFKSLYGKTDVAIVSTTVNTAAATHSESEEEEHYEDNLPTAASLGQLEEEDPVTEPEPETTPEPTPTPEPEKEPSFIEISDDDFVKEANVLIINNSTFNYTAFTEAGCDRFAELANKAGDLLEGKANLYISIVPENATSMLTREDREYYGFKPEEDAFERIYSQLNDNVKAVNVIPNLQKHNDEYIVFRTDHHWTALGAYYAYETWCEVAGVEPVPLSEYKEYEWEGFFGTYFYTTGELKILKETPDTVYAYEPPGNVKLYLNFTNGDGLGKESDIILDRSACRPGAKYMTFIGSDECRATFVNEDITDGSAVMVVKTSFGNPYVYYLTQHYQYVYVVDYRYYGGRGLTSFVENFDIDDVILCAGLGYVADSGGYSILNAYCN